ncbi:MAG: acyl-CoA reductase [Flammeovirgaceae bacterium]|nr:acyl-CoA reductase [Flammeovirgaceae bacterium]MDW8286572.1 acyl-CoA reductase [Flammeovirgaceae bacterium]
MLSVADRIAAFLRLGKAINQLNENQLKEITTECYHTNTWFDEKQVRAALRGIVCLLEETSFRRWANSYTYPTTSKKVGCIMAGNVPFVGVHDFICILMSGHDLYGKLSSQDTYLPKKIAALLCDIEPRFAQKIHWVEQLKNVDAVIATGSDNSARYFEYYFSKKPHIIRRNRVSVAILNGTETDEDFVALADDIFLYYGLGCRNVAKIFAPTGYDFTALLKALEPFGREAVQNHKYSNNYDYQKSLLLINKIPHLDNSYLMLKEDTGLVSPISVVFYEHYRDVAQLKELLSFVSAKIQCIVSKAGWFPNSVPFGKAQFPAIDDYADGVDTMKFCTTLC